jgi:hypothetical protein
LSLNSENKQPNTQTNSGQPDPSSEKEEKLPRGLVKHRTFNEVIISIGRRGCGKTEYNVDRCLDYARIPAFVVAHDLGWKVPDVLHDGRPTYVVRHSNVEEARKAIAKDPRGFHSISTPDALAVAALAEEIAEASLEKHGGDKGHPCIFYMDELVTANICNPSYLHPQMATLLAEARHRHVGIVAGIQSARLMHPQVLGLATHVQLFQVTDGKDHARLIESGIAPEIVAKLPRLGVGQSIKVKL